VSVLIPCYNAEKYIRETLGSVFAQTWPSIEVVVVDDGSADDSVGVVESVAGDRIKLVKERHRGQTATLNTCIAHASGDYIQYLDADDVLAPDKIALQMKRLAGHPTSIASAEWGRFHRETSEAVFTPENVWRDLQPIDWLALSRINGLGMMFPALWLVPAGIVKDAGPWNEKLTLNNDAEYYTRVLLASDRVVFCKGARCYYRSGISGSLSGRKTSDAWLSQFRVLELCESYVRTREDSDRVRRGFSLSWQHMAHACHPYNPDLAERALTRARKLHPVAIYPDGGRAFRAISRLIGWRIARKLQTLSGRP